ncbi:MAG: hypothetical protein MUE69_28900 [Myxococcota bacterium]|nr:hypothetical protein [Myxococcota bacterium]
MKSLRFVSLLLALVACGDDDGRVPDSGGPGVDGGGPIPGVDGGGPIPGVDGGGPIPGVDGGPIPGVDAGPGVDGGGSVTPGGPDSVGPFTVARQTATVSGSAVTAFVPTVSSPVPLVIFKHGFQLRLPALHEQLRDVDGAPRVARLRGRGHRQRWWRLRHPDRRPDQRRRT